MEKLLWDSVIKSRKSKKALRQALSANKTWALMKKVAEGENYKHMNKEIEKKIR